MLGLFKTKKAFKQNVNKAPQVTLTQEAEFERQRKVISMQKTLEEVRGRVDIAYQRIDQKQALVKDLIKNKRKAEAKRHLISLKALQDEVAKQENMCIILEKTKIQLEVASDTSKAIEVFKDAASLQKECEKNREYLEDYLIEKKEMDDQNAEIGKILNDIAAGDQEEVDEVDKMYAEMEHEVLDEDINKINKQQLKNAEKPRVEIQQVNQNSRRQEKQVEESSIDDLLLQASGYN